MAVKFDALGVVILKILGSFHRKTVQQEKKFPASVYIHTTTVLSREGGD